MDIIVDIDGTIADCRHRRHFVNNGNKDWKSFFESMTEDPPIQPIIMASNKLYMNGCRIALCTGRSKEYERHTLEWLAEHNVLFNKLYMRAAHDYRPDHDIKQELLDEIRDDGFDPILVFDDRQSVVDMWRANGIITLQNSMKEMP